MAKAIDKAYLLKQLKAFESKKVETKYVQKEDGKSLISATDLAKIGANESEISGVKTLIGTIPSDAEATNIVAYAQEVAEAAKEAATYDDTQVKADIKANKDAIDLLNDADTVEGSVAKSIKDAINDFATKISDDGTVNTFKEVLDYLSQHDGDYATLLASVQTNTASIETLNGTGTTSVSGKISTAIGDLGESENVKAYVDTQVEAAIEEATTEFETADIDFDTEW